MAPLNDEQLLRLATLLPPLLTAVAALSAALTSLSVAQAARRTARTAQRTAEAATEQAREAAKEQIRFALRDVVRRSDSPAAPPVGSAHPGTPRERVIPGAEVLPPPQPSQEGGTDE